MPPGMSVTSCRPKTSPWGLWEPQAPRCGRAGPAWGQRCPPQPPARTEGTVRPPSRDLARPGAPAPGHQSRSQADYDFYFLGRAWRWIRPLCYPGTGGTQHCHSITPGAAWTPCLARKRALSPRPALPQTSLAQELPPQNSAHSTPAKQSRGQRGGTRLPMHRWGSSGGAPCCSKGSLRSQSAPTPRPPPHPPELPQFPSARTTKPHSKGRALAVRREFYTHEKHH